MVRQTSADDDRTEFENRVTVRNADVEKGDRVRIVAFNPENGDEFDIIGEVSTVYADHKFAVQVDGDVPDGKSFIVNDDDKTVREGNHADGHDEVEGFRPSFVEFPADDEDDDNDDTLVFDHTSHGAHEKTGEGYTRVEEKRHAGTVTGDDPTTFKAVEFDGTFTLYDDGRVTYANPGDGVDEYEVGTDGKVE